jgi:hypothetical protein
MRDVFDIEYTDEVDNSGPKWIMDESRFNHINALIGKEIVEDSNSESYKILCIFNPSNIRKVVCLIIDRALLKAKTKDTHSHSNEDKVIKIIPSYFYKPEGLLEHCHPPTTHSYERNTKLGCVNAMENPPSEYKNQTVSLPNILLWTKLKDIEKYKSKDEYF